jgi:hypothetical protein
MAVAKNAPPRSAAGQAQGGGGWAKEGGIKGLTERAYGLGSLAREGCAGGDVCVVVVFGSIFVLGSDFSTFGRSPLINDKNDRMARPAIAIETRMIPILGCERVL